jgi:hypothetical protein
MASFKQCRLKHGNRANRGDFNISRKNIGTADNLRIVIRAA